MGYLKLSSSMCSDSVTTDKILVSHLPLVRMLPLRLLPLLLAQPLLLFSQMMTATAVAGSCLMMTGVMTARSAGSCSRLGQQQPRLHKQGVADVAEVGVALWTQ